MTLFAVSFPYLKGFFFLNLMPKRGGGQKYFPHQPFKVGRATAPSSFAHEVAVVKFELQTHMESEFMSIHIFSCVCVAQSSVFWAFIIFCQALNICLFVMLYLYIYII